MKRSVSCPKCSNHNSEGSTHCQFCKTALDLEGTAGVEGWTGKTWHCACGEINLRSAEVCRSCYSGRPERLVSEEIPPSDAVNAVETAETTQSETASIQVRTLSGETRTLTPSQLQDAVLRGEIDRNTPIRLPVQRGAKEDEKSQKWVPVSELVDKLPQLAAVYRPIGHYAISGLWIGAIAGYALKCLETTIAFTQFVPILALLLGVFLAVPLVSKYWSGAWIFAFWAGSVG